MSDKNYDYGDCHVCGGKMSERLTNQEFWVKENLIVIENVPAGVCSQCGEKVVKADVGQQITSLLISKRVQPKRSINVPVIEFTAAA